jgi:hypothetical protein
MVSKKRPKPEYMIYVCVYKCIQHQIYIFTHMCTCRLVAVKVHENLWTTYMCLLVDMCFEIFKIQIILIYWNPFYITEKGKASQHILWGFGKVDFKLCDDIRNI